MEIPLHSGAQSDASQEQSQEAPGVSTPAPGAQDAYTGKDLEMYRVLLAVERGKLSQAEAARRLEELEEQPPQEDPNVGNDL